MAENLESSGINLKKLQIKDYATLVEDLNYNFSMLLTSPLFKGTKGEPGETLPALEGVRGSRWYYPQFSAFYAQFPTLLSQAEITLNFINTKLSSDLQKLLLALGIEDGIVDGDTLLLPSGTIVSYSKVTSLFIDTGAYIQKSTSAVTQDWVIQKIQEGVQQSGITSESYVSTYGCVAKSWLDGSLVGSNLTTPSNNSILDIKVSESGPGAPVINHKFLSLIEKSSSSDINYILSDDVTLIVGAPTLYHRLVQKTIGTISDATTNDYGPGIDDSAALAILQNNYKNGLVFGTKNSSTGFKEFGRLFLSKYKEGNTEVNAVRLTSNYAKIDIHNPAKDLSSEFSELILNKAFAEIRVPGTASQIRLRSAFLNVYGKSTFLDDIVHTALSVTKNGSAYTNEIGTNNAASIINLRSPSVRLNALASKKFLATDANGKIIDSGFAVDTLISVPAGAAYPIKHPENNTSKIITANKLYEVIVSIAEQLALLATATGGDLSSLLTQVNNLSNSLSQETAARIAADNQLTSVINSNYQTLNTRITNEVTTLNNRITTVNNDLIQRINTESANRTAAIQALIPEKFQYGMIIDIWTNSTSKSEAESKYSQMFETTGIGKAAAKVYKNAELFVTMNLSKFAVCDGRNNTPDFRGRVSMHADYDINPNGTVSFRTHYLDYGVNTPVNPIAYFYAGSYHGLEKMSIAERNLPEHEHEVSVGTAGFHDHALSGYGIHTHRVTAGDAGQHAHTFSGANSTISINGNTGYGGIHSHSYWRPGSGTGNESFDSVGAGSGENIYRVPYNTDNASSHTHTVNLSTTYTPAGSVAANGLHNHCIDIVDTGEHSHVVVESGSHVHNAVANAVGEYEGFNTMQPSLVLYKVMYVG